MWKRRNRGYVARSRAKKKAKEQQKHQQWMEQRRRQWRRQLQEEEASNDEVRLLHRIDIQYETLPIEGVDSDMNNQLLEVKTILNSPVTLVKDVATIGKLRCLAEVIREQGGIYITELSGLLAPHRIERFSNEEIVEGIRADFSRTRVDKDQIELNEAERSWYDRDVRFANGVVSGQSLGGSIDWNAVSTEWGNHLRLWLGLSGEVCIEVIEVTSNTQLPDRFDEPPKELSLDELMENNGSIAAYIHDNKQVLVATLRKDLAAIAYKKLQLSLGLLQTQPSLSGRG
jgi:hypothetical protein